MTSEALVAGIPKEGYRLSIEREQIRIESSDTAGAFYGRDAGADCLLE